MKRRGRSSAGAPPPRAGRDTIPSPPGSQKGQAAPLNVVIKDRTGDGVRIEVVFQTLGGMVLSLDAAREELCNILQAGG